MTIDEAMALGSNPSDSDGMPSLKAVVDLINDNPLQDKVIISKYIYNALVEEIIDNRDRLGYPYLACREDGEPYRLGVFVCNKQVFSDRDG